MTCTLTWTDHHPAVDHDEHQCVFRTSLPHTRHECRCGLNYFGLFPVASPV